MSSLQEQGAHNHDPGCSCLVLILTLQSEGFKDLISYMLRTDYADFTCMA